MDFVYICRQGDNEELRYSIRSVVKNFNNPNIWVFGYKPKWYTGNFVSVKDRATKFDNITNAMKEIASHQGVSDDFVLMNDDFFVLSIQESPQNFCGGTLSEKIIEYTSLTPSSIYTLLIKQTRKFLRSKGISEPIDYDLHTPMIFNKQKLLETIDFRLMPRSVYGNLHGIDAKKISDVKKYSSSSRLKSRSYSISNDSMYVSSEDNSFENLYNTILKDMFPEPSQYELV